MVRVVGHKPKCVQEKVYLYQLTKKKSPRVRCVHTPIYVYTLFLTCVADSFFSFSPPFVLLSSFFV